MAHFYNKILISVTSNELFICYWLYSTFTPTYSLFSDQDQSNVLVPSCNVKKLGYYFWDKKME